MIIDAILRASSECGFHGSLWLDPTCQAWIDYMRGDEDDFAPLREATFEADRLGRIAWTFLVQARAA